jgi:hypothetical protein
MLAHITKCFLLLPAEDRLLWTARSHPTPSLLSCTQYLHSPNAPRSLARAASRERCIAIFALWAWCAAAAFHQSTAEAHFRARLRAWASLTSRCCSCRNRAKAERPRNAARSTRCPEILRSTQSRVTVAASSHAMSLQAPNVESRLLRIWTPLLRTSSVSGGLILVLSRQPSTIPRAKASLAEQLQRRIRARWQRRRPM